MKHIEIEVLPSTGFAFEPPGYLKIPTSPGASNTKPALGGRDRSIRVNNRYTTWVGMVGTSLDMLFIYKLP